MAGILAGASRVGVRAPPARGSAALQPRGANLTPGQSAASSPAPRLTVPRPPLPAPAADRGAMMMKIYHASGIALAGTSSPDHRRPSPDPRRDPSASETFVFVCAYDAPDGSTPTRED